MYKKAIFIFFLHCTFAEQPSLFIDPHFSPFMGAENFLTLQTQMERIEDRYFPSLSPIQQEFPKNQPNISEWYGEDWKQRLRMFFFWLPINFSMAVTQHEVFGHGYRIRDLGPKYATVDGYGIYIASGVTNFEITSQLSSPLLLTIDIAGIEADGIMADQIRMRWLKNQSLDTRESILYFVSSLSLLNYSLTVDETPTSYPEDGNDISGYLFLVNAIYKKGNVDYKSLQRLSIVNLLDPFVFYSLFSSFDYKNYKKSIPMISIGSLKYLPSVRTILTPFGVQGCLDQFFIYDRHLVHTLLKWGKNGPLSFYSLGMETADIFSWFYGTFGFRFNLWYQPHVPFKIGAMNAIDLMEFKGTIPDLYPEEVLYRRTLGCLASMTGTLGKQAWPIKACYEFGFKTKGYVPGESLRQSAIVRFGLSGNY